MDRVGSLYRAVTVFDRFFDYDGAVSINEQTASIMVSNFGKNEAEFPVSMDELFVVCRNPPFLSPYRIDIFRPSKIHRRVKILWQKR